MRVNASWMPSTALDAGDIDKMTKMIQVPALLGQGVGKKPSKPITKIIYGSGGAVQSVRG